MIENFSQESIYSPLSSHAEKQRAGEHWVVDQVGEVFQPEAKMRKITERFAIKSLN